MGVVAETVQFLGSPAGGGGGEGGGGSKRRSIRHAIDRAQNDVLLEIFKANLELAKSVSGMAAAEAPAAAAAPSP